MEFNALAAKETSALLKRVLGTTSQTSLKRVDALRAALETATKALEEAVATTPDFDRDVEEVANRIAKAAAAEADIRLKHLSAEARKITDALRAELADVIGEKEALAISLKDSRAQLESVARRDFRPNRSSHRQPRSSSRTSMPRIKKLESARADAIASTRQGRRGSRDGGERTSDASLASRHDSQGRKARRHRSPKPPLRISARRKSPRARRTARHRRPRQN